MLYDPVRGKHHPAPWELEVQSGLRGLRLPRPDGEILLLCLDSDEEIASVIRFSFDVEGEQVLILAVATRTDLRSRGLGKDTLETALGIIKQTKVRYGLDCGVWARIRPKNEPSKRLFDSAGFDYISTEADLETWVLS